MKPPYAHGAVHADAGVAAPVEEIRARPFALLDGGEIIELSIKPSAWQVAIVAGRFVTACAVLFALTCAFAAPSQSLMGAAAASLFGVAAVLRVGEAALQWATRLYVLTNRRVLRFRGVLAVEVQECPLARVGKVELLESGVQRRLRLGTIRMSALDGDSGSCVWEHLAQPRAVYQTLLRAIRRAQNGPS